MIVPSQAGEQIQVLGDSVCLKLRSSDSPHRMAAVTVEVPPGGAVPPHQHSVEEESYYLLKGSLAMRVGNQEVTLTAGDFVHVPPATMHGYRNDSEQSTLFLAWMIGGAIDEFFVEMAENVRDIPDDLVKVPEILNKYGITMDTPI